MRLYGGARRWGVPEHLTPNRTCVIMANMKTANVRKVQHHLSEVLRWIEAGQEVAITRRNRIVARMIPASAPRHPVKLPDFVKRAKSIWGNRLKGKPVSHIIIEDRADRL